MKKHLLLILVMLVFCFATPISAAEFAGGTGTETNPYQIETKEQLNNVRNYLNAYFELTADIEFTESDFAEGGTFCNNGAGWEPIGNSKTNPFTGVFDGNGYKISGLYINLEASSGVYAGLFGYNKGTIQNVALVDGNISLKNTTSSSNINVGGIAGENYGTVRNSYNTGTVTGESTYYNARVYIGGVVGYNDETVESCYNTGTVNGKNESTTVYAGGVAGSNYGTIRNSSNRGRINAESISNIYAGGIAGYNSETINNSYNSGSLSAEGTSNHVFVGGIVGYHIGSLGDCYNAGTVSSPLYAGGIVGKNDFALISNSYNVGTVTPCRYGGGIAGYSDSGTVRNGYYLDTVDQGVGDGYNAGVKCTAEEMQKAETFAGFDFDDVWEMGTAENYQFPTLKAVPHVGGFFVDVLGSDWFAPYVYDLVDQGILNGMTDTTFVPMEPVTRAQFTKILAVASGEDMTEFKGKTSFDDIDDSAWYAEFVQWGYEKGIIKGMGNNIFAPDAHITREQMAVMICRYANYKGVELPRKNPAAAFDDDASISSWAKENVSAMQQSDIITGYAKGDGYIFDPQGLSTRAAAAAMVSRFLHL